MQDEDRQRTERFGCSAEGRTDPRQTIAVMSPQIVQTGHKRDLGHIVGNHTDTYQPHSVGSMVMLLFIAWP